MHIRNKTSLTRLWGVNKAPCSESMRFWKININISNVINTSLSLHLTVKSGSSPDGWRNITLIGFVWKKKVTYTYDASKAKKTKTNFHFWVNKPFMQYNFKYFNAKNYLNHLYTATLIWYYSFYIIRFHKTSVNLSSLILVYTFREELRLILLH